MERLLEKLDELDDVSNVYHNWEEYVKVLYYPAIHKKFN